MADFSIDPRTTLGPVHITVSDFGTAMPFYRDLMGLTVIEGSEGRATLGVGSTPVVVLREKPGARPKPPRTTGLYHFAILLPSRADLARVLKRFAEARYPLGGASDHLVSEALYLDDPDGNGIEIYSDRPRESWPRAGDMIAMATNPLDVNGLMAELGPGEDGWKGAPEGTRLGHVHLHVADLPRAEAFYHGLLGFDVMARYGAQASFLSAGGYHHHLGLNTWAGVGAPPPPPDAVGLEYFEIYLPTQAALDEEVQRLRDGGAGMEEMDGGFMTLDPSQNRVVLKMRDTGSRPG